MPKLDIPLRLSPVFKPKIWGKRDLGSLFERPKPAAGGRQTVDGAPPDDDEGLIGEVWLTDDAATFLNGPVAGMTLADASREYGPELNGQGWKHERFPILAKNI